MTRPVDLLASMAADQLKSHRLHTGCCMSAVAKTLIDQLERLGESLPTDAVLLPNRSAYKDRLTITNKGASLFIKIFYPSRGMGDDTVEDLLHELPFEVQFNVVHHLLLELARVQQATDRQLVAVCRDIQRHR